MTAAGPDDPIVVLNQVLDEVLDLMLEVRQADRKVPIGRFRRPTNYTASLIGSPVTW